MDLALAVPPQRLNTRGLLKCGIRGASLGGAYTPDRSLRGRRRGEPFQPRQDPELLNRGLTLKVLRRIARARWARGRVWRL